MFSIRQTLHGLFHPGKPNPHKKLAIRDLGRITLGEGGSARGNTPCAMQVVAWLAGEDDTWHPTCTAKHLRGLVVGVNDSAGDLTRQRLKPILPLLIDLRPQFSHTFAALGELGIKHHAHFEDGAISGLSVDDTIRLVKYLDRYRNDDPPLTEADRRFLADVEQGKIKSQVKSLDSDG